jgi:hypothetical protein
MDQNSIVANGERMILSDRQVTYFELFFIRLDNLENSKFATFRAVDQVARHQVVRVDPSTP